MNARKLRLLGAAVKAAAKLTGWDAVISHTIDTAGVVPGGSAGRFAVGESLKELVCYHFVYESELHCKVGNSNIEMIKLVIYRATAEEYCEAMQRYRLSQVEWEDAKVVFLGDLIRDAAHRSGVSAFLRSACTVATAADAGVVSGRASIRALGELFVRLLTCGDTVAELFGDDADDATHLAYDLRDDGVILAIAREILL